VGSVTSIHLSFTKSQSSCGSSSLHDSHAVTSQRYLLKWSVPLGHVDVIEYSSSPGPGEHCRFSAVHSPESLAVMANVKPRK
jgi:Rho guanine nucleotide exchange factor 10